MIFFAVYNEFNVINIKGKNKDYEEQLLPPHSLWEITTLCITFGLYSQPKTDLKTISATFPFVSSVKTFESTGKNLERIKDENVEKLSTLLIVKVDKSGYIHVDTLHFEGG